MQHVFAWEFGSVWTIAQSGPRRLAWNCCFRVSNVAEEVSWQQGWMRRVWRACSQRWSRHLKPELHLHTELDLTFFISIFLVKSLLFLFTLVSYCLFCSVFLLLASSLSYLHLSFLAPSIHFLLSPSAFYILSLLFFPLCPQQYTFPFCVSGSLYQSSQEAVVWDIPVFTMIDYGLSSIIGVMFSCKITLGFFFSLGANLLVTFI